MATEIQEGIKEEAEHKKTIRFLKAFHKSRGRFPNDREIQKSITKDHLMKNKNYYKELTKAGL